VVTESFERQFDPAQAYKVGMQGVKDSGIIERFVVALLRLPLKLLAPLIEEAASLVDDALTVLAEAFQAAQGQHASGYYRLAAALYTDLLGIEMDGDKLWRDFTSGGRQAAMVALGSGIFDVLAAEFAGVAQTGATGAFSVTKGAGIGGLPDVLLSPAQGLDGARAFLGFASAFAIREGNTDLLASLIPNGYGEIFKDFAEDFAKNLGIGRIARLVYKPLVTTLVATPAQWALNEQYRPTRFDVGQAYRAWAASQFTDVELDRELTQHGWLDRRKDGLKWQHLKGPDRTTLRALHAVGAIDDADYALWEGRDGRVAEVTALLDQHDDVLPARNAVLLTAHTYATSYLHGRLTTANFHTAIDALASTSTGQKFLTDGEVANLKALTAGAVAGTRTHMRVTQLMREYEDGILTLGEFEQRVTDLGYSPDDVQLLVQELLIAAKRAADRAAQATTRARRGRLAHLSIAQLKTAFVDGLLNIAEIRAELALRQYSPDAIDTVVNEFLIAAKLRPPTPPQA